ncbi:hypothetical protein AHAS_Ahas04G0102000 [Arachis hypogaea]
MLAPLEDVPHAINEEDDQEEVKTPKKRRPQRGEEQGPNALELSGMRITIEEMSQQLMQAQQEQYLQHQEQYLKDREENKAWQRRMEERQESWQQQIMAQQKEFQTRSYEGQKKQSKDFKESYDKLYLSQAKYGAYTHNLYQWKNIHHTIEESRHTDIIEFDEDTQEKLDYLTHNMPVLNPQIKPFEQCQELRDCQQAKTERHSSWMHQRLETARLSGLIDSVWDRRCPGEEAQDYFKLWKRKKKKGESSKNQGHNNYKLA